MLGLIGTVLGSIVGVAGGLLGTWMSIRNMPRGEQRSFMARMAVVGWIGAFGFCVALLLIPTSWNGFLWLVYVPGLFIFIRHVNRGSVRAP
jgi:hypothetical protein